MNTVQVGLGVIIVRNDGKILIGKRKGSHAPYYSIPGGKLELGESFEAGAIREIQEEHGILISNLKVIAVTNNLETFKESGIHFISVVLVADTFEGIPVILEPGKCEEILWTDPLSLPRPHFDASRFGVQCWLEGMPYVQSEGA